MSNKDPLRSVGQEEITAIIRCFKRLEMRYAKPPIGLRRIDLLNNARGHKPFYKKGHLSTWIAAVFKKMLDDEILMEIEDPNGRPTPLVSRTRHPLWSEISAYASDYEHSTNWGAYKTMEPGESTILSTTTDRLRLASEMRFFITEGGKKFYCRPGKETATIEIFRSE